MYYRLVLVFVLTAFITSCKKDQCIDQNKINTKVGCFEIYKPVCGCDGKTYSNSCVAENYYGVTSWKPGPCGDTPKGDGCIDPKKIDPSLMCPTVIDPVCGCDGVTYNNSCDAERNGVLKWSKGSCQIDTTAMPCIEVCGDSCVTLYAPRTITMKSFPQQGYSYRWKPAGNLSSNTAAYMFCPKENTTVYLELWVTQCRIPLRPNEGFCGFEELPREGSQVVDPMKGGKGIMPGGCIPKFPQVTTRLSKVIKYCVNVKNCDDRATN